MSRRPACSQIDGGDAREERGTHHWGGRREGSIASNSFSPTCQTRHLQYGNVYHSRVVQQGGLETKGGPLTDRRSSLFNGGAVFKKRGPTQPGFMRREKERFGRSSRHACFRLLLSPLAVASCAGVILAHYVKSTAIAHRSATGTRRYAQVHSPCTRYPRTRCLVLDVLNSAVGRY